MNENPSNSLLERAKQALDHKDFAQASAMYQEANAAHPDRMTDWNLWGWARALYKLKKYQEALDVCRIAYKNFPKFSPIHTVYAWSIYHTVITKTTKDKHVILKAAQAIVNLSPIEDAYGPSMKTLFKVTEYFVKNNDFAQALHWIDRIPISDLSTDIFAFKTADGKKVEIASDKEKYFALKSKSQLKLKRFDACIETCQKGLEAISKFHYNNNIWFRWRMVASYIGLKKWDEAKKVLEDIMKKKDDWFFKDAMAEILIGQDKKKEALPWLAEAALAYGEIDKKIGLFKKMTLLLDKMNQVEMAKKHLQLVLSILNTNQWNVPDNMAQLAQKYNLEDNATGYRKLVGPLKADWTTLSMVGKPLKKGEIQLILPNGNAGFIKSGKKTYYFKMSDTEEKTLVKGQKVQFLLKSGFDKKKNKATEVAYRISKIK